MLIETGTLTRRSLAGQVAIVTGAGQGIGYEAARAMVWMGAHVVIAEINRKTGKEAEKRLNEEFGEGAVTFIHTDVGNERSITTLAKWALQTLGKVDIVLNNATIGPLGAVKDVPIRDWDASYGVNLRGPVMLARAFLPGMQERNYGVFVCVSSVGQAYMGAYEIIKGAQVELANTIDAEMEGTGVIAFTIGPGFVPTQTALSSIPPLAEMMGINVSELQDILKEQTVSIEAAGAGFAAAVAMAERYRGREIHSMQALSDAGIELPTEGRTIEQVLNEEDFEKALPICKKVRATLVEQSEGWKQRSTFEQQWLSRSFKKHAGMPVTEWLEALESIERCLEGQDWITLANTHASLGGLASFYESLYEAGKGYIKDPAQREEYLEIVQGWIGDVKGLDALLRGASLD